MQKNTSQQLTIKDFKELPAIKNIEQESIILQQNKELKNIVDFMEKERKEETKPILDAKKNIDTKWQTRMKPFADRIASNKLLLAQWLDYQEVEKAKELQSEDFSAKESRDLAKLDTKVNSNVSFRIDYDLEVLDINKVPSKFIIKSVDEKAVKEWFKENQKQIAGLKIKEIKTIINR